MGSPRGSLAAKDRLILAVDTSTVEEARRIIDELCPYVGVFKIGLQLFMNAGPPALSIFHQMGVRIFFDGKFLDIPNTVAKASEAVASAGVQMFTVHSTGGSKMLTACASAAADAAAAAGKPAPLVLGVTVLTSISEQMLQRELNVAVPVGEQVTALARLCLDNGVKAVVASPEELGALRTAFGAELTIVTPGVRPTWAEANDQSRIMTPSQALQAGADYLVVGRPILAAKDRINAAKRIVDEMETALAAV